MRLVRENNSFYITDLKLEKKYEYAKYTRDNDLGSRHYNVGDIKIPSVTTILSATQSEGIVGPVEAKAAMDKVQGNKEAYEQYFKTGIMPNAPAKREFDPENAPAIEIDPYLQSNIRKQNTQQGQRTGSIVRGSEMPLPNVTPSNLPMGGQQSNTELAQALNLFNKGGIVSAKKSF